MTDALITEAGIMVEQLQCWVFLCVEETTSFGDRNTIKQPKYYLEGMPINRYIFAPRPPGLVVTFGGHQDKANWTRF